MKQFFPITILLGLLALNSCFHIADEQTAGITTTGNTASIIGALHYSGQLARRNTIALNADSVEVWLLDSIGTVLDTQWQTLTGIFQFDSLAAGHYQIWVSQEINGIGSDTTQIVLQKNEAKHVSIGLSDGKGYRSNCDHPVWKNFQYMSSLDSTKWYLTGTLTGLENYSGNLGYTHAYAAYGYATAADFVSCGSIYDPAIQAVRAAGYLQYASPEDGSFQTTDLCTYIPRSSQDGPTIATTLSVTTECGEVDTTMNIPTLMK